MPLNCPSESELLLFALAEESERDDSITPHLLGCSACRRQVADLLVVARGIEASSSRMVVGDGAHLDEIALAEFLEARENPALRAGRIAHLAECGHCRLQLATLIRLLDDPGVSAELRQLERAPGRWSLRRRQLVGAGLAAAAVLLALGVPRLVDEGTPLERDPTITATSAPVPVAPLGDVPAAEALRWASVSGADRYRVTLFDDSGRVRYETETADTVAALPDSMALVPGRSYLWKVEARTELERWASSALHEFRVSRRSP